MAQTNKPVSPTLSSEDPISTPAPVFHEPSNLPRPERKLTKEERDYLNTRLSEYHALQSTLATKADGPRGVKNVKGDKKAWIQAHVFEDFKKKFNSAAPGGPALDSLFKEICIWFNNNRDKNIGPGKLSAISLSKAPAKRPRAKTAEDIFADENKAKITKAMSHKRTQNGSTTKVNLPDYNRLKKDLFLALPESERAQYQKKASDHKVSLQGESDPSHIFANQKTLVPTTIRALHELGGHNWGKHGDVVFFVMGAYRDENEKIMTFNASVGENIQTKGNAPSNFVNDFPGNYLEDLRKPFKIWATKMLPILSQNPDEVQLGNKAEPSPTILYRTDGFPLLPAIDFDNISPTNGRPLLTAYILGVWEFALSSEEALTEIPPIPWDALDNAEHRSTLLMDPEPFSSFKSLDPVRMSATDMYDILNLITNAQEEEHYLLEFNVNDDIVVDLISSYTVDPDDIDEVADPPPTTVKKSAKKNRGRTSKRVILDSALRSNSPGGSVPDFSPPSRTNLNKVSGTFSPVGATSTLPTNHVESGLLPEDVIVSALHAVAAHNSSIGLPSTSNTIPPDVSDPTVVPGGSDVQSGRKRSRIDAAQTSPDDPSDRSQKRVRLVEKPETLSPLTAPSPSATPIMLPSKERAPKGTKRGRKSKAGASRPKPSAGADEKKEKTKPAVKPSKPPPPPRQASKRINAESYTNTAVTIRRET